MVFNAVTLTLDSAFLVLKRGILYYLYNTLYREAHRNILLPYRTTRTDNRFVSATYIISYAAMVL